MQGQTSVQRLRVGFTEQLVVVFGSHLDVNFERLGGLPPAHSLDLCRRSLSTMESGGKRDTKTVPAKSASLDRAHSRHLEKELEKPVGVASTHPDVVVVDEERRALAIVMLVEASAKLQVRQSEKRVAYLPELEVKVDGPVTPHLSGTVALRLVRVDHDIVTRLGVEEETSRRDRVELSSKEPAKR